MENQTLKTLKRIGQTHLFALDYHDDYKFDDFLKIGADSDAGVNKFIVSNLLNGRRMDYNLPDLGCSTFSAYLDSGDKVFGRNFDQQDCMQLVLTTRPQNGYSSISVVNLSYLGLVKETPVIDERNLHFFLAAPYVPLDGVNEKGLAIGILLIRKQPTSQKRGNIPLTSTTAIRMILDKCATVDEAVGMLASYDMNSSANVDYHFHLSDRHGNSAVIEYIDNEMKISGSHYATNFLLTSDENIGGGHDRYEKMQSEIEKHSGKLSGIQHAMAVLESVAGDSTRWSSVYNQSKPSLTISVDRDYSNTYSFSI